MTEDERKMITDVHDFLFKAPVKGKPTRAMEVDDALAAVRAGKIGTRIVLWMAGLVIAIGTAVKIGGE